MDAAIFGCKTYYYIAMLPSSGEINRAVPITRGAGICRFSFAAASFVMLCSLSSPVFGSHSL